MSQALYGRIGAGAGLVVGILLMLGLGQSGMIAGAIFGATGAVLGGICGEVLYRNVRS